MPVTIIKGDRIFKYKPLEDQEFEIEYRRLSDRSILRCIRKIVGDSADLEDLGLTGMNTADLLEISTELLEQAVTGWSGLYTDEEPFEEVAFDKESVEFLPLPIKMSCGLQIIELLTQGAELFSKKSTKSQPGKKKQRDGKKNKTA